MSAYYKRKIKKLKQEIFILKDELKWERKTLEAIKKYGKITEHDIIRFRGLARQDALIANLTAPNPLFQKLKDFKL